ncbi:type I-B CRISPR-associated endonuclease Cas1b [Sporanaerobacter sp. PP17-6a]|uniref:type I-B CRISPR-associated endonuclease Cas1b n=1 Tax=Sporanaerobacter sp. PP17-6a TaxID=1891289 RepID=UPI00089FD090|nr:type I-B CRISPR-associated endonuclease Cas1b [Sporanaerobacter sp. PP17-6a]SCL81407.1 CRISPR-associated endonuclease Cas1 [Sporanaerobacter sp. PP17-6a]
MKLGETFYIINNGDLRRKDNNIIITGTNGESKNLKVEVADEIYIFGEVNLNTKVLNFLSQNRIILHVFNYYGFYSGSYYPRETNVSGYLLVNQVRHYDNYEKRIVIARKILNASAHNIYRNLRYYNGRGVELEQFMSQIELLANTIDDGNSIEEIMGIEGNIRKIYYSSWNNIIKQNVEFDKRVKRPPDNMVNSLISFINSLVYTTTLSEIYKTQLNPTISYLHQPGTRRFSLSLDLSEIFKPLIADRMIFSMLNKNQITENDFDKDSNFLYLRENAKRKILAEYDNRLKNTIFHKELGRDVSYKYLIRLECYKLIKHLIGEKEYEAFKMWW